MIDDVLAETEEEEVEAGEAEDELEQDRNDEEDMMGMIEGAGEMDRDDVANNTLVNFEASMTEEGVDEEWVPSNKKTQKKGKFQQNSNRRGKRTTYYTILVSIQSSYFSRQKILIMVESIDYSFHFD